MITLMIKLWVTFGMSFSNYRKNILELRESVVCIKTQLALSNFKINLRRILEDIVIKTIEGNQIYKKSFFFYINYV